MQRKLLIGSFAAVYVYAISSMYTQISKEHKYISFRCCGR